MIKLQKPARSEGENDRSQKEPPVIDETSDDTRLPNSEKIYVETKGSSAGHNNHTLRVPFREIALTPSKGIDGTIEQNPPVRVYDTSGPWTDPAHKHDVREG